MDKHEDTLLKETAVAIGGAAGKLAALAKSALPHAKAAAGAPKPQRAGKLPPKNKSRLPRKEKKSLARKEARAAQKAM